jgi:hypothetical protein
MWKRKDSSVICTAMPYRTTDSILQNFEKLKNTFDYPNELKLKFMEDEKYHNHTLYITMIKEDGVWVGDDCTDGIFSYKQCSLDNIRQQKEVIMKDEK